MTKSINIKSLTLLLFALFYLIIGDAPCAAQYENIWAFGINAGVDFNSTPPKVIQTAINTSEGSASICDDQGQLLFYTDGFKVWDRNNSLMPNGTDLSGVGVNITASTTQGALIIPMPGNVRQYYIFSLGSIDARSYAGDLYYSIVDISLNNGLGAVVAGRKGILLGKGLTEHMSAVSGGNCNLWLMVIRNHDTKFMVYNVDFNGIDTVPVVSDKVAGEGQYKGVLGSIDVAPNRSKLAIAQGNLVLYDFNSNTGKISNALILDKGFSPYYYGVCFSPDNSKLYGSTESPLFQFDLTYSDTNAIMASKIQISLPPAYPAVKRGPDGKVYCAGGWSNALNVINQPNLAGLSCQYVANCLPLVSGTSCQYGLPNAANMVINRKHYSSTADTAYCSDSFLLEAKINSGVNYVWEDGSTGASRYVKNTGTYWISYQAFNTQCDDYVDTFRPVLFAVKRTYTTTTFAGMCSADTFSMIPANALAPNYTWEDGSTSWIRQMNRSGTFWVRYQNDTACEHFVDTFLLTYPEKNYEASFSSDTVICQQQLLSLRNTSDSHYQSFNWFLGDGQSSLLKDLDHLYSLPGTYEILLTGRINDKCLDSVTHLLQVDAALPVRFVVDRDMLCVGESIAVSHQMHSNTIQKIVWQWGDGRELGATTDYSVQHAYDTSGLMPVAIHVNFRSCPDDSFSIPVRVFALPEVHLYSDDGLCLKGFPLTLKSRRQNPTAAYHNLWSTGSASDSIRVTHSGHYGLTVSTEPLGCSTTETIEIGKDCYIDIPNAFTPNGDGVNDFFFPRQLLSRSLIRFTMQIFNRWGQAVFETQETTGRGWDGRCKALQQPEDVYVYRIMMTFNGVAPEQYVGNVTLIR